MVHVNSEESSHLHGHFFFLSCYFSLQIVTFKTGNLAGVPWTIIFLSFSYPVSFSISLFLKNILAVMGIEPRASPMVVGKPSITE